MLSNEPALELVGLLRRSFPELDVARFEESLEHEWSLSSCSTWTAFSVQFNEWVTDGRVAPIERALILADRLLRGALLAHERAVEVSDEARKSLITCFLDNVVDSSPEWRTNGRPYLASAIQSYLQEDQPWWLRDPAE